MNLLALTVFDPLYSFIYAFPEWFNPIALLTLVLVMIPNIIYAVKNRGSSGVNHASKAMVVLEQIGRYGSMATFLFAIPPWLPYDVGYKEAYLYALVNINLAILYCIFWRIFAKYNNKFKALTLSILPSVIFLFSGIIFLNIPLIVFAAIFAVSHITISYKNAAGSSEKSKENTL